MHDFTQKHFHMQYLIWSDSSVMKAHQMLKFKDDKLRPGAVFQLCQRASDMSKLI